MNIFAHYLPERNRRGFTILLAALIASLVLALGISVFSIAQKQLILSSTGRNSLLAFYAADTAAECALYFDMRGAAFDPLNAITPINCDDANVADPTAIIVTHTPDPSVPADDFSFEFEPNGYCARVLVTKQNVHPRTTIHADGFSVPCEEIEVSGRSLQRSVELTY